MTDTFDNSQRWMIVRSIDQRTEAGLDGDHCSILLLLLSHSPNPFIKVTFVFISDVGRLLISQQSTESTLVLVPILSGAELKIQLCRMKYCLQVSLNGFRHLREGYYTNIVIKLTHI